MTRVSVLYNDDTTLAHGAPNDAIAVGAVADCARAVRGALAERGHQVELIGMKPNAHEVLRVVADLRTDVVFNLVEAIGGEARMEQAFAWLCELHGLAYTGAPPRAMGLCVDKPVTKAVLAAAGLPVPRGMVFERGDEPLTHLAFPMIVKPSREDASHGISAHSVVRDETALRRQVLAMIETYAQPALAEEYIDAREINAALLARGEHLDLLPLSEIDYSGFEPNEPHIVTYAGKWIETSRDWELTRVVPAENLTKVQRAEIESVARGAFEVLGLRDYGRVDLRLDRHGKPFIIDVNPNPDISPDAGFHLAAERAGIEYADIVERIVAGAARRNCATA